MHLHSQQLIALAAQVGSLAVWMIIFSAIFVPLERLFALRKQRIFRRELANDLGYYFINGVLIGTALGVPLSLVAWGAHNVMPWSVQTAIRNLPLWARAAVAMCAGELGYYWGHRLSHEIPFLWRFHAIHHSAETLDFLVNNRGHPVDVVFAHLCTFAPLYIIGVADPLSASGNAFAVAILFFGGGWSYFIHANIRWRLGPLEWLIASPAFHHWHHTRSGPVNRNYSTMLPVLDVIFGTYYLPRGEWPADYGIESAMPAGFVGQLLDPLDPARPIMPAPERARVPEVTPQRRRGR